MLHALYHVPTQMRLGTNQFHFAIAFLFFLCAPSALAQGISTVGDYADRIERARRMAREALEQNSEADLAARLNAIKQLLPANEEVEFNGAITRVDNAWLHEAVDNVVKTSVSDAEKRNSMLSGISIRLGRLGQSVKAARTAGEPASPDKRAKLDGILARPEYQPEKERESFIARLLKQTWRLIIQILVKLLEGASAREPRTVGVGLIVILRTLIFLAVIAAVIFGAVKLIVRFQARQKPETGEKEKREALGEIIEEGVTAADLFAMAADLARQGEYRKAIRRAYIALLCDLDQRGKLSLGRAKTNRDYLDAIRSERRIYPAFALMTAAFERAWYGQRGATQEEFQNFVALYQEAIK